MEKGEKKEGNKLKIDLIVEGVVIDRIEPGQAPEVIKILGIKPGTDKVVSIAINVSSKSMGRKDIVKIEGRELDPIEINKIAIIAPRARINVIKDTQVINKYDVEIPAVIEGLIRCQNPTCITRAVRDDNPSIPKEPVKTRFHTLDSGSEKPTFECHYCHLTLTREEAIGALI